MRKFWLAAPVMLLAGCGGNPDVPPTVSWQLGAANPDNVPYQGPKPAYSWATAPSADTATSSAQAAKPQYAFDSNGASMRILPVPSAPQQVAAPAPATQRTGSAGTHS